MSLPKAKHGYILPQENGVYARITRQKKRFQRYFSFKLCGGKQGAYREAVKFLDEIHGSMPRIPHGSNRKLATKTYRNKRSDLPPGVTKTFYTSRGERHVKYIVVYSDGDRPRFKSFYVGRESHQDFDTRKDREMKQKALRFRKEYEKARKSGKLAEFIRSTP